MREITRNPSERKPNASPDIKPNFDSFYFASQPKSDYFCHHFEPNTVPKEKFYKRSTFVTHLPMNYLYSPTHAWAEEIEPKRWRVGITKFATRMLGEMVDLGFELNQGDPIKHGQIIGWLEGFKAISDLYAVINGQFVASNPLLEKAISGVSDSPYQDGWLYEAKGEPDPRCMAVDDYAGLLDSTIDKILEQQASDS